MTSVPSDDTAQVEPEKKDNAPAYPRQEPISTIAGLPKISNEWGYAGARSQGPGGALPITSAVSYQEHVTSSSNLRFLMGNGFEILPLDVRESIRCITTHGALRIIGFRRGQLEELQRRAKKLLPELHRMRGNLDAERFPTRARIHVPLVNGAAKTSRDGRGEMARPAC